MRCHLTSMPGRGTAMPPSPWVDTTCAAPASPIMLAHAGVASQDVPPLSSRPAGSCSTQHKLQPPPVGSDRDLFAKEFSLTTRASEDAADRLLSHYPACGLRGPDVALRI